MVYFCYLFLCPMESFAMTILQIITYWIRCGNKQKINCWLWNLKTWNNQVQACTARLHMYLEIWVESSQVSTMHCIAILHKTKLHQKFYQRDLTFIFFFYISVLNPLKWIPEIGPSWLGKFNFHFAVTQWGNIIYKRDFVPN